MINVATSKTNFITAALGKPKLSAVMSLLLAARTTGRLAVHMASNFIGAGAALALLSAALFGASTPFAKLLIGTVDPWLLAGLLYLGSGLGLAMAQLARRAAGIAPAEAPLRRTDLPWLALVVLFGGMVAPVLLMAGLIRTDASTAALLLNLEGLFTLVIAWTVFRENVDRRVALGAAAILAGALILSWTPDADLSWGALAIAGACLAWGVDNNLTRKLSAADPIQIAAIKGLGAGTVNLILAMSLGAAWPSAGTVLAAGVVGLLGYGVSLVLFVLALRHVGTARTGAYFSTAPFLGALLALSLLGEAMTAQLALAAALMGIGVWLHLTERHEHEHVHEPLVHEHRHVHDEHHAHAHVTDDPTGEPHVHVHAHARLIHRHPHYPDIHHRHTH
jgi:drug/metabolite transporter (DMT)-like permease